eukprot:330052-Alexandrium_andersonii.AAC.1
MVVGNGQRASSIGSIVLLLARTTIAKKPQARSSLVVEVASQEGAAADDLAKRQLLEQQAPLLIMCLESAWAEQRISRGESSVGAARARCLRVRCWNLPQKSHSFDCGRHPGPPLVPAAR